MSKLKLTKEQILEIEEGASYNWLYKCIKELVTDNPIYRGYNDEQFRNVIGNLMTLILNNNILADWIVEDINNTKPMFDLINYKTKTFLDKYNRCLNVNNLLNCKYKAIQKRFESYCMLELSVLTCMI